MDPLETNHDHGEPRGADDSIDIFKVSVFCVVVGVALWLWNCVLVPLAYLALCAFDTALHAVNPAHDAVYRGPFPNSFAPLVSYSNALIYAGAAVLAFRLVRRVARSVIGQR